MLEDHEPRQPGEIRAFVEYRNQPRPQPQRYFVGWDIGQSMDYSAVAVLKKTAGNYVVNHLERLPLGMEYPDQIEHVYSLVSRKPLAGADTTVCLDRTGVGAPVYDATRKKGINAVGLTLHGGDAVTWDEERIAVKAPKKDVIGCLLVLAQCGSIKIAKGLPHGDTLLKELRDYKIRFNPNTANVSFGNGREAEHDDLVLSVAIPLWIAENRYPWPNPVFRYLSTGHSRRGRW